MSHADLLEDVNRVRATADLLFTTAEIDQALDKLAIDITDCLKDADPVVLCMMTGGIVPLSFLLPRFTFPLQVDYVHASRYGENITGGQIEWVRHPPAEISGRNVLLVDDLLDRGTTLQIAVDECRNMGAGSILTAVLITKTVENRPGLAAADFSALTSPDRWVFGYGMDYKTYWRNGAGIFAVAD